MIGSYLLIIELENDKIITIGRLGEIKFKKGFYVYVGSALNGLEQRIQRHLRKNKKTHWHIDYLLKHSKIIDIFYKENKIKEECIIAKKFEDKLIFLSGFGCSDCKCKSHLFYGPYNKIRTILDRLELKEYFIDENY